MNKPNDSLGELKDRHLETAKRYLSLRDFVDAPHQAIGPDMLVAMADYIAFRLTQEEITK